VLPLALRLPLVMLAWQPGLQVLLRQVLPQRAQQPVWQV
jgi:hypothetical protein